MSCCVIPIIHPTQANPVGSLEQLLKATQMTERQVRLAVAYRESYPDEVAEAMAQNRRNVEEWRELYPFVELSTAP